MPNLERRVGLLEGNVAFDADGREPRLVAFARWFAKRAAWRSI
jgi:hypothetical protein